MWPFTQYGAHSNNLLEGKNEISVSATKERMKSELKMNYGDYVISKYTLGFHLKMVSDVKKQSYRFIWPHGMFSSCLLQRVVDIL